FPASLGVIRPSRLRRRGGRFFKPRTRIFVLPAGTPIAVAPLGASGGGPALPPPPLRGGPKPPPRAIAHHDVGVLARELIEGRQQFVALSGAKRRRLTIDQDRPVGIARRHGRDLNLRI